jgi:hypothetical protein
MGFAGSPTAFSIARSVITSSLPMATPSLAVNGATYESSSKGIQFPNTNDPRKLVLYSGVNNAFQYYGFGMSASQRDYMTQTSVDHVFYTGTSTTARSELLRIKANGTTNVNGILNVNTSTVAGTPSVPLRIKASNSSGNNDRLFGLFDTATGTERWNFTSLTIG